MYCVLQEIFEGIDICHFCQYKFIGEILRIFMKRDNRDRDTV